jgi:hypothetical protein
MNIGVADNQTKRWLGLYENGGGLGETSEAPQWRGQMAGLRACTLTI